MTKTSCRDGKIQSGSLCVDATTTKAAIVDCVDVDLAKVLSGSKVTMCDGSTGVGTFAACSADGQVDCSTSSTFKAAKISNFSASKIALGTTIAGVVGTKTDIKQCRNAAQLTLYDSHYPPTNLAGATGLTFPPANINTGSDTIDLSSTHGLAADFPVKFSSTTTLPSPLISGTTYYVIVISTTTLKLAATPSGAAIDITSIGAGTHTIVPAPDGVASYWDTTDDYNNNLGGSPANNPWSSSDYVCDSSNFTNVSGSANLVPSMTIPATGNQSFNQIWQDKLTGLYFTNVLYDGSTTKTWADAILTCESLNGAKAGSGWRLPVQKELMQLYIDGIAKLSLSGGTLNASFWTSSAVSNMTAYAWASVPSLGYSGSFSNRGLTTYSVLCVR